MDILNINLIYFIGGALGVSLVSLTIIKKNKKKEEQLKNNISNNSIPNNEFFVFTNQEENIEEEKTENIDKNENPIIEAKVFLTFGLKEQAIIVLKEGLKDKNKKIYHNNIENILKCIQENEIFFNIQNWQNSWEYIDETENPLEKAEFLYLNGKYSDAIEILEQELLKNPDNITEIRKKLIKIGERIVLL